MANEADVLKALEKRPGSRRRVAGGRERGQRNQCRGGEGLCLHSGDPARAKEREVIRVAVERAVETSPESSGR